MKNIKKPEYFIIKFPNGTEALIKIKGWAGINPYLKYFKDEYNDSTFLVSITRREARKFLKTGELFHVSQ